MLKKSWYSTSPVRLLYISAQVRAGILPRRPTSQPASHVSQYHSIHLLFFSVKVVCCVATHVEQGSTNVLPSTNFFCAHTWQDVVYTHRPFLLINSRQTGRICHCAKRANTVVFITHIFVNASMRRSWHPSIDLATVCVTTAQIRFGSTLMNTVILSILYGVKWLWCQSIWQPCPKSAHHAPRIQGHTPFQTNPFPSFSRSKIPEVQQASQK